MDMSDDVLIAKKISRPSGNIYSNVGQHIIRK